MASSQLIGTIDFLNIVLGIMLALLILNYMKVYSKLNESWKRLLILSIIYIVKEVFAFMDQEFFSLVMKTIFVGYLLYFLSYITDVAKEVKNADDDKEIMKERFKELKIREIG